jgi:O-antigen biosynthesis protein WbqP
MKHALTENHCYAEVRMLWHKRLLDIILSGLIVLLFSPLLIVATLCIKATSKGSVLHWSMRVGRNNLIFMMPKFRSMRMETPQVATHLLVNPMSYLTPIGGFLRRTSLDELPQLFSVLRGHLSLVGPRPALFNQDDLIARRTELNVHKLVPGITGWAQVNGRDELAISEKVRLDAEYLRRQSLGFDLKILVMTAFKVARREGVAH